MSEPNATRRPQCKQCERPLSHCLCAHISVVANRTHVLILQHPDERKHALNTARLAVLGLQHAELRVGERFPELEHTIAAYDKVFLLFPLDTTHRVEPARHETDPGTVLLIVPDGTWRNTRKIIQANPILHTLAYIRLSSNEPSQYRIRKAPHPEALSTIEAITRTLTTLEPEQNFLPLLLPFHALIDQQIAAMGAEVYKRNYKRDFSALTEV